MQTNNKLREALTKILNLTNSLDEDCAVDPVEIRDIAKDALAEPVRNYETKATLLKLPIEGLNLSTRAKNALLVCARISTVGDLVRLTEREVLKTRAIGPKSKREIQSMLAELGLTLRREELSGVTAEANRILNIGGAK